jgi:hypothetical protein
MIMMRNARMWVTVLVFGLFVATAADAATFLGPTPYLSQADSPFDLSGLGVSFYLEDFEDGLLNTPGVTASAGDPYPPTGITDSVDGDDGHIDGSGTAGHSFFYGSGATGIRFTFNADQLGFLPTQAGIVWTDGAGTTTFEAFDANGASLGQIGPVAIADGSIAGTTAEDRFFGVIHDGGISAIKISNTSGGIEVDHLQYGIAAPACHAPPQDTDGDGDVDLADFLAFQACFNGPNRAYADGAPPDVCHCLDVEPASGDADVDLADFLVFQGCFNGPNRPPACP